MREGGIQRNISLPFLNLVRESKSREYNHDLTRSAAVSRHPLEREREREREREFEGGSEGGRV